MGLASWRWQTILFTQLMPVAHISNGGKGGGWVTFYLVMMLTILKYKYSISIKQ